MTTAPNPYAEYYRAYAREHREEKRLKQQRRREQARERERAKWAAYGLDVIVNDWAVTCAGYLSGLCEEVERECLDFAGSTLPGDHIRAMVIDGSAPSGLVIKCRQGYFVVTGRRLEPLPEGVAWRQLA